MTAAPDRKGQDGRVKPTLHEQLRSLVMAEKELNNHPPARNGETRPPDRPPMVKDLSLQKEPTAPVKASPAGGKQGQKQPAGAKGSADPYGDLLLDRLDQLFPVAGLKPATGSQARPPATPAAGKGPASAARDAEGTPSRNGASPPRLTTLQKPGDLLRGMPVVKVPGPGTGEDRGKVPPRPPVPADPGRAVSLTDPGRSVAREAEREAMEDLDPGEQSQVPLKIRARMEQEQSAGRAPPAGVGVNGLESMISGIDGAILKAEKGAVSAVGGGMAGKGQAGATPAAQTAGAIPQAQAKAGAAGKSSREPVTVPAPASTPQVHAGASPRAADKPAVSTAGPSPPARGGDGAPVTEAAGAASAGSPPPMKPAPAGAAASPPGVQGKGAAAATPAPVPVAPEAAPSAGTRPVPSSKVPVAPVATKGSASAASPPVPAAPEAAPGKKGKPAPVPAAPAELSPVPKKQGLLARLHLSGSPKKKGKKKAKEPFPGTPQGEASPGGDAGGATPAEGKKTQKGVFGLTEKIRKMLEPTPLEVVCADFSPGAISVPSLEGALRDVNITYLVEEPYQYVRIAFDPAEMALIYSVVEPSLSPDEVQALETIERVFEKLISTEHNFVLGSDREAYLKARFDSILAIFAINVRGEQKERLFFHLKKKYLGYARIDTLMKDRYIEDISCNGPKNPLYILHRIYGSIRTNVSFEEVELNNFVLRLAQIAGRHLSLLQPIRDVSLPDGSRGNLTLGGEVTKKGSTFTIRKFRSFPISPIELMDYGTIDAGQLAYLWILMEYKRSILVSGGTATGKTTLLNVLCAFIPPEYKIVSIEDTAELNLMHPNWIQAVARAGFGMSEGGVSGVSGVSGISGGGRRAPGEISLYDLLVAALRQRPEFIIVGEVRGEEAYTLFQAIAVGHAALGTVHAGSMDELLARVESQPMMVPRTLISNLDAVIFPMHIKKGERAMRRIANVIEVLEMDREKGDLITNTVYRWLPESDVFKFLGKSYLFEKIQTSLGVSQEHLMKELLDRANLLKWMQKMGIRDYHDVVEIIREYYRDKSRVEERMNQEMARRLGMAGNAGETAGTASPPPAVPGTPPAR